MQVFKADSPEAEAALRALEERRTRSETEALRVADDAIAGVRARGDAYVREQILRFDDLEFDDILIEPRDVTIDPKMAEAIDLAITRVDAFHRDQLPRGYAWKDTVAGAPRK